jgi:hypothetical protein
MEFAVGHVWSKNGGSKDAMRAIAGQVGELLNGVIAATGSQVYDPGGVETGTYAVKKRTYGYGQQRHAGYIFNSGDPAAIINHGAFIALSDLSERVISLDSVEAVRRERQNPCDRFVVRRGAACRVGDHEHKIVCSV